MKNSVLLLFACFFAACGGDFISDENRLYEVRMMNGGSIYAKSKPKLEADGFYRFNDVNKQEYSIKKNLVLSIAPAKVKK